MSLYGYIEVVTLIVLGKFKRFTDHTMDNWIKTKVAIAKEVNEVVSSLKFPILDVDISVIIDLFEKLLRINIGVKTIDGVSRSIIPAIQSIMTNGVSDLGAFKVLAEEIEPYYKKLIYIKDATDVSLDRNETLFPCIKRLDLLQTFQGPDLNRKSVFDNRTNESYIDEEECIRYYKFAYTIRNDVHNSTDWTYSETILHVKNLLVAYLLPIIQHKDVLDAKMAEMLRNSKSYMLYENELSSQVKALYEFISLGNDTIEIKNQILDSSIIYYIYDHKQSTIEDLKTYCEELYNLGSDTQFYQKIINRLLTIGRIKKDPTDRNKYVLRDEELARVTMAIETFVNQEKLFLYNYEQLVNLYGVSGEKRDELLQILSGTLQDNYNIPIAELIESDKINADVSTEKLISFIQQNVSTDAIDVKHFLSDLLKLCEDNNFLHKLCASRVISKYTNEAKLQSFVRQQDNIVYLDAQILIYALCYYSDSYCDEFSPYYSSVKDIISLKRNNHNIKLYTTEQYVAEAAYHIREALMLIPFEEFGYFNKSVSSNVFYNFYLYKKRESKIEDDATFEMFMAEFDVYYKDIFQKKFNNIIDVITEVLEQDIEIVGEVTPVDIDSDVFDCFKSACVLNGKSRSTQPICNDASMLKFLTDENDGPTPFFVTLDSVFYQARKRYYDYRRACNAFYIYSPARYATNYTLSRLSIKTDSVSKEIMSILDAENFKDKTDNFIDIISSFMTSDNEESSIKRIRSIREFKNKYIIDADTEQEVDPTTEEKREPYVELIKHISYHYNNCEKYTLKDIRLAIQDDETYNALENVFEEELCEYVNNGAFSDNIFCNIDKVIGCIKDVH